VNLATFADLAVRLVNSAANGRDADPLRDRDAARDLTGNGPFHAIPVTRHDLESLRALRAELSVVFAAAAAGRGDEVAARLNALLLVHPLQPVIARHDRESLHLHLNENGSLAERYAAGAVSSLVMIVTQIGLHRLGVCAIAACPRVFIGSTRSRRYCDEHAAARASVTELGRPHRAAS
jgi:predicted RNA-binding Zn ribbon-like protein